MTGDSGARQVGAAAEVHEHGHRVRGLRHRLDHARVRAGDHKRVAGLSGRLHVGRRGVRRDGHASPLLNEALGEVDDVEIHLERHTEGEAVGLRYEVADDEAFILLNIIWCGVPRLTERCGEFTYNAGMKPLVRRVAKRLELTPASV